MRTHLMTAAVALAVLGATSAVHAQGAGPRQGVQSTQQDPGREQILEQIRQARDQAREAQLDLRQAREQGDPQAIELARDKTRQALRTLETRLSEARDLPMVQDTENSRRAFLQAERHVRQSLAALNEPVRAGAPPRQERQAFADSVGGDVVGPQIDIEQAQAQVDVRQVAPQVQLQQRPPEVEIQQRPPEVVVNQPAPQIIVKQSPARIIVRYYPPEVTVRQFEPEVIVRQREPEVLIEQANPEVAVNQPQPQVQVQAVEPEVEIRQVEPEVAIQQARPEVQVEQPRPDVQVVPGRPAVAVTQPRPEVDVRTPQPRVSVEQGRPQVGVQGLQPEVEVQQARPDVQVQQGQPEVDVEQAEPEVGVRRPGTLMESVEPPPAAETLPPERDGEVVIRDGEERRSQTEPEGLMQRQSLITTPESAENNAAGGPGCRAAIGSDGEWNVFVRRPASVVVGRVVVGQDGSRLGEVANPLLSPESDGISGLVIRLDDGIAEQARMVRIPYGDAVIPARAARIVVPLGSDNATTAPPFRYSTNTTALYAQGRL